MATIQERIIKYLQEHLEGADDDELAVALNLRARQHANMCCRALAAKGIIRRVKLESKKIRNYWKGAIPPETVPPEADERWCWEGNVQASVVRYLVGKGYSIIRVANTGKRERGRDIEARIDSRMLWVTVKGYPKGTPRTRPQTEAGHWFSGALFDIIWWRGEDPEPELAVALPDFPRYRNLAQKVSWLKSAARFHFLWVAESGHVEVER